MPWPLRNGQCTHRCAVLVIVVAFTIPLPPPCCLLQLSEAPEDGGTASPLPGVLIDSPGSAGKRSGKAMRAFTKQEVTSVLSTYIDALGLSHPTSKSIIVRCPCGAVLAIAAGVVLAAFPIPHPMYYAFQLIHWCCLLRLRTWMDP